MRRRASVLLILIGLCACMECGCGKRENTNAAPPTPSAPTEVSTERETPAIESAAPPVDLLKELGNEAPRAEDTRASVVEMVQRAREAEARMRDLVARGIIRPRSVPFLLGVIGSAQLRDTKEKFDVEFSGDGLAVTAFRCTAFSDRIGGTRDLSRCYSLLLHPAGFLIRFERGDWTEGVSLRQNGRLDRYSRKLLPGMYSEVIWKEDGSLLFEGIRDYRGTEQYSDFD
ncbi:MAG: hypothetical protein JXA57_14540 [Armatimonadetes bacterium]|nr:hypothetical protein [Armatimonadota bacterium]